MSNTTRRNRLLASCAAAAIATLTAHAPVRAQAFPTPISGGFQGTVLGEAQGAIVTTPTATNTRVEVVAPRAIINWTPHDNRTGTSEAIDFLPAGRSADFVNTSNRVSQDYVVLNRILPSDTGRVVAFNGAVRSTLSSIAGAAEGGQVWFYTPGGILVGAGASFNVGSLLLTAGNVTDADFFNADNRFSFVASTGSTAEVRIANGGQVNALGQNAYVALIAPRVVQSGAVTVAGSAQYVAAEAVDMTINGSLFDIAVQVGSSVDGSRKENAALVHDGTTTLQGEETGYGPPEPAPGRSAVLVAVPKNDAVTMLVQGAINYEPATGAQVSGNRIILSGGRNTVANEIDAFSRPGDPNGVANIRIDNREVDNNVFARTTFGGDVDASATGAISVEARNTFPENGYGAPPADIDFAGNVSLRGDRGVDVAARGRVGLERRGGSIRVGGDLAMISDVTTGMLGGNVRLSSGAGARIDVLGNAELSADLVGAGNSDAINTRIAEIVATSGGISIGGSATLTANAIGGFGGEGGSGGSATGGTARIDISAGGEVTISEGTELQASGLGGTSDGRSGAGRGGDTSITVTDARFTSGSTVLDATGSGGGRRGSASGGEGIGGTAVVTATNSTTVLGAGGLAASGSGGDGLLGGNATGGVAALDAAGGSLSAGEGGEGGDRFTVAAFGNGGDGDFTNDGQTGGSGGEGLGGVARIGISGGAQVTITGNTGVDASGFGGDADESAGAMGGVGRGGNASVTVGGGSALRQTGNVSERFNVAASGFGAEGRRSGDGRGGQANVSVTDSTASFSELRVSSDGFTSFSINGGDGVAGRSLVTLVRSTFGVAETFSLTASGFGGISEAIAGRGVGGEALMMATGSTATFGEFLVSASGFGSGGVTGGDASGGTATVDIVGGRFAAGANGGRIIVDASAFGGRGDESEEVAASGGDALAGTARLTGSQSAALTLGGFTLILAEGFAGNTANQNAGSMGGTGTGGDASVAVTSAASLDFSAGEGLQLRASAESGQGITGGGATGGTATLLASGGRISTGGDVAVRADAIAGGGSGQGGIAQGGAALIRASGADAVLLFGSETTVVASANGGDEEIDFESIPADGGAAAGGASALEALAGGRITFGPATSVSIEAIGRGQAAFETGGTGTGGVTSILAAGGAIETPGDILLSARGLAGISIDSEVGYGDGIGGSATFGISTLPGLTGSITARDVTLLADGRGNAMPTERIPFGGAGRGGLIETSVDGNLTLASLTLNVAGVGGEGGFGPNGLASDGGEGRGGTANVALSGGTVEIGSLSLLAMGEGGDGGLGGTLPFNRSPGGDGGDGIGGTVSLTVTGVAPSIGSVEVALDGRGGDGDVDFGGGNGGLGQGGTLTIAIAAGGELFIPTQSYSASGFGGDGALGFRDGRNGGAGGNGIGGTIDISVEDSSFGAPSEVGYGTTFVARGQGGAGGDGAGVNFESTRSRGGDGGRGGIGTGGTVSLTGTNADLEFGGLTLDTIASGGAGGNGGSSFTDGRTGGNGGSGGGAAGGTSSLVITDSGTGNLSVTGFGGIALSARAEGGRGGSGGVGSVGGISGDGGAAAGGSVRLDLAGALTIAAQITGDVSASGGDGGDGFDNGYGAQSAAGGAGGSGTGGAITLAVASGDVQLAPGVQLSAFGNGGGGGRSDSLAGGGGGNGTGGAIDVAATGGQLSAPALRLRADGFGANGGAGGDDVRGGDGGDGGGAEGGAITLRTSGDGRLVTNPGEGRGLEAHADARAGLGGDGGDGSEVGDTGGRGGVGGQALGGSVSFDVAGGEMDLGDIKVTANGWGGSFSSGGIGAGQEGVTDNPDTPEDETVDPIPETVAPGGSDGRGAGGTIGFRVADAETGEAGRFTAGAVSLRATGRFGGGDNDAAGLISLVRTAAAPDSRFQIASLEARALGVNGEAPNGFELSSSAGAIEVLNNAAVEVDRDAALRASGSGTLTVGGELNLLVGGNLDLTQALGATQPLAGADFIRINAGSVTGASAALTAVRDIRVVSPGSVSFGLLDAGDDILIDAFSASLGRAITRGPDEPGEEENAGSDIVVDTIGDIEFLIGATAADDISLTSSEGAIRNAGAQAGGLEATNEIAVQAEREIVLASATAGGRIDLRSVGGDVRLDNGSTPDVIAVSADNGSFLSAGLLQANVLSVGVGNDIAINDVEVTSDLNLSAFGGAISGGRFRSDRDIDLAARDGVNVAALDAFSFIGVNGGSGPISIGSATTSALGGEGGDGIFLRTNGLVTLDQADSAGVIDAEGFGFGGGDLRADRSIRIFITEQDRGEEALLARVAALGDIAFDSADAGTFVSLSAPGAISAGTIVAGENIVAEGGSIAVTGAATAGRDVLLEAAGDILLAAATAGDDVEATSFDGAIDAGRVVTTGLGEDLGEETGYGPGPGDGSNIRLAAQGDVRLDDGDAVNLIELTATAGQVFSASLLKASDLLVASAGDIALADADIRNDIALDAGVGAISGADFTSGGAITLTASESVTLASATAGDDITILAGTTASVASVTTTGLGTDSDGDGFGISIEAAGDVGFGAANAVGDLRLVSREGGIVRLDGSGASLIDAGGSLFVSAADDLNLSSVLAGRDITLISGGAIDTGNLTAPGALSLTAGAGLSADVVRAGSLLADAASIDFADVELAGVLNLATPGALVLGRAKASDIVGAASRVRAGTLEAAGNIVLSAAMDGVEVGAALAGSDIALSGRIVSLSDGTAGRDIRVDASGDATIGSARAGDDFTANVGGAFTGTTVITTGQGPDGEDNGYGTLAAVANDGSNIRVTSVGAIALETGTAADAIALASSNGAISSTKALTAGTGLLVSAAGAVSLADATAGDGIDLVAGTGIGAANLIGGTDVRLQAKGGDVMLTTARAGDDIDVTATGATTIARATTTGSAPDDGNNGSSVLVTSPGGVSLARIESAGGAVLRAANGAVTVSDDLRSVRPVEASGRAVSLRSLGALGVRSAVATAGNVALTSAGNLSLESADASGTVAAASAATLGITGTVGGAQIALSSRDIAIGSAAQIGSAQRTGPIQVTANGTSATAPAVVGGSGQGSNYRLDNAEFGRLAAQNVAVSVQGETAALQVDTLTVRQPSVTRSLTLSSSGDVAMIGRLTYENAGADNVVRVNAARAFTANAPGAGIVVANAQGALTGSIDVDAPSIVVASAQAQADLATTGNIAARDDRLGRNDGETDNAGFLRAGAIRLAASERIFVQNSGLTSDENDDRAGLSAGVGGITLVTKGTSPVEIVINGRQDDGAGGVIVGAALIEELTITGQEGGPGSFAPGSTVNGCLIGGSNCLGLPLDFGVSVEPLLSELTEEEDEDEEDGAFAGPPSVGFSQLITTDGSPLLPVIDDPVTGAGNDDLSTGTGPVDIDNSQRDRDEQVNAPVTGTGNEALQGETTPPTPAGSRPDGQPTIDDPVTGAGNDDLQDGPNR